MTLMATTGDEKVPKAHLPRVADKEGSTLINFEVQNKKLHEYDDQESQKNEENDVRPAVKQNKAINPELSPVNPSYSEINKPLQYRTLREDFEITVETFNKFESLPIENDSKTNDDEKASIQFNGHIEGNYQKLKLGREIKKNNQERVFGTLKTM